MLVNHSIDSVISKKPFKTTFVRQTDGNACYLSNNGQTGVVKQLELFFMLMGGDASKWIACELLILFDLAYHTPFAGGCIAMQNTHLDALA